jgi:hypothetical protein
MVPKSQNGGAQVMTNCGFLEPSKERLVAQMYAIESTDG